MNIKLHLNEETGEVSEVTINEVTLTVEQLENVSLARTNYANGIKAAYSHMRKIMGEDSTAAAELWTLFLTADEDAHQYRLASNQVEMQNQMRYISDEEWSTIVD